MKLLELKCKNCGSTLRINPESDKVNCEYCHTTYKIDEERTDVKIDDMEQYGYEFEKGRIKAQRENRNVINIENNNMQYKKKKNIWLIFAWIYFFPFTATYFIAKSNKLDRKKKIIIIAAMWIILLAIVNNK